MNSVKHADLPEFARSMLERISSRPLGSDGSEQKAFLIALSGNLGAGKTTFIQALARELGVREVVQSPTYVLMKSYPISSHNFTKLVHIDAYRLNTPEEFASLKPEEFLNNLHNLVCIEWPERVEGSLPAPNITINFSSENARDDSRYIEVV